jgi:hypothetical protein
LPGILSQSFTAGSLVTVTVAGPGRQSGCLKSFNWNQAKPYVADPPDAAVAAGVGGGGAAAERARVVRRYVSGTDAPLVCDVCHEDVVGPCFECVHCPGRFTVCSGCEPAEAARHAAAHVFLVHFGPDPEAESSAGLWSESSAGLESDSDPGPDSEVDSDTF